MKIEKYYENLKLLVSKYNILSDPDEFFQDYGPKLKSAPFSTSEDYGGAYEGGLLITLYEKYLPFLFSFKDTLMGSELSYESALKVILFQHIAKAEYFTPTKEDWKRKKGIHYDFTDRDTRLKCGEYSYLIASRYGLKLTDIEYEAFLSIDKKEPDSISMYSSELTSFIFFINNVVQRRLMKENKK